MIPTSISMNISPNSPLLIMIVSAWIALGHPGLAAPEAEPWPPRLVGDLGGIDRLAFVGVSYFETNEMRVKLAKNLEFQLASTPSARFGDYLDTTRQLLLRAYRRQGFPEIAIEARPDPQTRRVRLEFKEGPQYRWAGLQVKGGKTITPETLLGKIEELSTKLPETNTALLAIDEVQPGSPVPFGGMTIKLYEQRARQVLAGLGYLNPQLTISLQTNAARLNAGLVIDLADEGPKSFIGQIEVTGVKKNRPEAVIDFLVLKPGMPLDSGVLQRAEKKLRESARFLRATVEAKPEGNAGRVNLLLNLAESAEAPALAVEFSKEQRAMLKFREWLEQWFQHPAEDLVLNLRGPAHADQNTGSADFTMVFSKWGLAFLVRQPVAAGSKPGQIIFAQVVSADLFGCFNPLRRQKLIWPKCERQITLFMKIAANPPDSENPLEFQIGAGIKSADAGQPIKLETELLPAAFLHNPSGSVAWKGNLLEMSGEYGRVCLDSETGRLEYATSPEKETSVEARWVARKAYFATVIQEIGEASHGHANVYDPQKPLTSTVNFFLPEILDWGAGSGSSSNFFPNRFPALGKLLAASPFNFSPRPDQIRAISGALDKLSRQPILAPLEDWLAGNGHPETAKKPAFNPGFPDLGAAWANSLMLLVAEAALEWNDHLLPVGSWPWRIVREICFNAAGQGKYTGQELQAMLDDPRTGPLGCLAIAEVLAQLKSPLAPVFANRGLQHLTPEAFESDCRLFLAGDPVLPQCLQRLLAALGQLDAGEADALASVLPGAEADLLRGVAKAVKTQGSAAGNVLPSLRIYWDSALQERLRKRFWSYLLKPGQAGETEAGQSGGTAQPEAVEPGSLSSTGAKTETIQRAADQGNAAAQHRMGELYENGEGGLAQNVQEALRWYARAAGNGWVNAQVTLGNIYSDGILVPANPVESCFWYTLAARQGHPAAGVLRQMIQRKLTGEQAAELKKRLEIYGQGNQETARPQ